MGKSTDARNRKGKFGSGRGATYATAPRRGPPAVFVSCESGREKKCQREALELLHHYYYASRSRPSQSKVESGEEEETGAAQDSSSADANNKKSSGDDDKPLSLEEELAMLRKGAMAEEVLTYEQGSKRQRTAGGGYTKKSSMKSPFSIYDTGMRGMVCILCNLPDSEMIPYDEILAEIKAAKENDENEAATADGGGGSGGGGGTKEGDTNNEAPKATVSTSKTSEVAKDSSDEKKDTDKVLWDPVETVRCILRDGKSAAAKDDGESNKDEVSEDRKEDTSGENQLASASPPPGSRFILRIVPFQATCFASVEEIKAVSTALLKRFLPTFKATRNKDDKKLTFKLEIKKRLCSHVKQEQIIDAVAPIVAEGLEETMPECKVSVNLSDPDFSVRIETMRSLCGISILPRESWYKNFNLAEITHPTTDKKEKPGNN